MSATASRAVWFASKRVHDPGVRAVEDRAVVDLDGGAVLDGVGELEALFARFARGGRSREVDERDLRVGALRVELAAEGRGAFRGVVALRRGDAGHVDNDAVGAVERHGREAGAEGHLLREVVDVHLFGGIAVDLSHDGFGLFFRGAEADLRAGARDGDGLDDFVRAGFIARGERSGLEGDLLGGLRRVVEDGEGAA